MPVVSAAPGAPIASVIEDPLDASNPGFLEGPSTPPNPVAGQVGVAAQADTNKMTGTAIYQRNVGAIADTCNAPGLTFLATITVTNLNNGHQLTCVNRANKLLSTGDTIQLSTDYFLKIAELVDSPIPVSITWVDP